MTFSFVVISLAISSPDLLHSCEWFLFCAGRCIPLDFTTFDASFYPFTSLYQFGEPNRRASDQMVKERTRQRAQEHVHQLFVRQRRLDSSRKVSPLLGIIFKTFTGTHRHTLQLCTSRGEVSIILVLLVESSSQIFPITHIGSF